LNSGSTVRTYPTHGAQLSSLSLRPHSAAASPTPSPITNGHKLQPEASKLNVQVNAGPDFFQPRLSPVSTPTVNGENPPLQAPSNVPPGATEDIEMENPVSPYDPLFDDEGEADADGETIPASTIANTPRGSDVLKISTQATPSTSNPDIPQQTPTNPPLFSTPPTGPSRQAAATIPVLSPVDWRSFSNDVLLTSSMDGQVTLIDRRVARGNGGVGRLLPGEKAPPWCMSVSLAHRLHYQPPYRLAGRETEIKF
jgi:transcriptional activator SPT8